VNEYTKFDIPLRSCRQLWHLNTYTATPDKGMVFVQTSGGRKYSPKYESGLKAAIDSLKPEKEHLWRYGHYLWSAELELDKVKDRMYGAYLFCMIGLELEKLDRPKEWKIKTRLIIKPALQESRHLKPPDMSVSRNDLYTKAQKEAFGKVGVGNYDKSLADKWDWIAGLLDDWERLALVPVAEWMNQKEDANNGA